LGINSTVPVYVPAVRVDGFTVNESDVGEFWLALATLIQGALEIAVKFTGFPLPAVVT